jgi:hypothetical protein
VTQITGEEIGSMLAALAIYRIGLTDLEFREDEADARDTRDKTLIFVSEVLGPKIVSRVDQIEAELRARSERGY